MILANAIFVSQVVGHKEGLDVMERADPLFLLIGLPTIPVMLILGKMIRWEDYVLRLWRKYSNKLQILNSIFPGKALNCGCNKHAKFILWGILACKHIAAILIYKYNTLHCFLQELVVLFLEFQLRRIL